VQKEQTENTYEADKFGKLDILNGPGKIIFLDLKPGILEEH